MSDFTLFRVRVLRPQPSHAAGTQTHCVGDALQSVCLADKGPCFCAPVGHQLNVSTSKGASHPLADKLARNSSLTVDTWCCVLR